MYRILGLAPVVLLLSNAWGTPCDPLLLSMKEKAAAEAFREWNRTPTLVKPAITVSPPIPDGPMVSFIVELALEQRFEAYKVTEYATRVEVKKASVSQSQENEFAAVADALRRDLKQKYPRKKLGRVNVETTRQRGYDYAVDVEVLSEIGPKRELYVGQKEPTGAIRFVAQASEG